MKSIKALSELPTNIGQILLGAGGGKAFTLPFLDRTEPGKLPHGIGLPFQRGMKFMTICGGEKFLVRYSKPLENGYASFFGGEKGEDEKVHAFLVAIDDNAFDICAKKGECAFHEAILPDEFRELQAAIGQTKIRYQGDLCAAKLPHKWDDLRDHHWYLNGKKDVRKTPVAGTRSTLHGRLFTKANISVSPSTRFHSVSIGDGTVMAEDFAPLTLGTAPHLFGKLRMVHLL